MPRFKFLVDTLCGKNPTLPTRTKATLLQDTVDSIVDKLSGVKLQSAMPDLKSAIDSGQTFADKLPDLHTTLTKLHPPTSNVFFDKFFGEQPPSAWKDEFMQTELRFPTAPPVA